MSSWHRDDSLSDADLIEMWGAGVETQEYRWLNEFVTKRCLYHCQKNDKKKISCASDVGVCFRITGARFPYYISFSTIGWARRNGNLLVQIDPKNGSQTDKVTDGVWIDWGYLPPPPTSYLTSPPPPAQDKGPIILTQRAFKKEQVIGIYDAYLISPPAPGPSWKIPLRISSGLLCFWKKE